MKTKVKIQSRVFLIILILLFVVIVVSYFFIFREIALDRGSWVEESAGLTDETITAIDELELKKDMLRFLDVYFKQKFDNDQDRQVFVEKEYERFLTHTTATGAEQDLLARFISDLGELLKNGGKDIFLNKTAEQDLLKIKKELSN